MSAALTGSAEPSANPASPWDLAQELISEPTTTPASVLNNQTQKSIKELFYNGTGYYIEEEEAAKAETGLNDLQTVFLACFATLVPLIISLLTAFGIRVLWTRYKKQREDPKYDGILERQDTAESIPRPLHSHLMNDKKCTETHLAITTEEVEVCDGTGVSQIRSNNHSSTNGSIITMTLKNNHLIVETEERNDIEEDSRETTMKYSPGARDGVFVVEVQQGVRRSPGSGGPTSQAEPELSGSVSDQCALVHHPPDRYSDDETLEECDDYIETTSPTRDSVAEIRTGLARSNTSLQSSGRSSYCNSKQHCYDSGSYGYHHYSGYTNDEPDHKIREKHSNKPKITAALYKNQSKTFEESDYSCMENNNKSAISGTAEADVGFAECENTGSEIEIESRSSNGDEKLVKN